MGKIVRVRVVALVGAVALVALAMARVPPLAAAPDIANSAFAQQWQAAEATVPNFWGATVSGGIPEPYAEGMDGTQSGMRRVQYFDKARMELTTPTANVTNGLLTVELVSGKRQTGDNTFASYPPSNSPVAGDADNSFPTYASLATLPAKVAEDRTPVARLLKPGGTFATDATLGADPKAAFGAFQSDPGGQYAHNIPAGMWAYLQALPVPWLTVMGYPTTEPFWARVKVAGVQRDVLVQAYQRRVLTYTPSNPAAFQVEMGNIGQHYFLWRYTTAPDGSNPTATPTPSATATVTPATATPATAAASTATGTAAGTATGGVTIAIVAAPGAHPGSATILQIKTAPGATCTLDYKPPGGTSARWGGAVVADKTGFIEWSFPAGGNEKNPAPKGQGVETITCNGVTITQNITIG